MNDNVIASDGPLSGEEQEILCALADTLIPASEDGVMPSAGSLDVGSHVREFHSEYLEELQATVGRFEAGFAGLSLPARVEHLQAFSEAEPQRFRALLAHVYACYYQNDEVLDGIGVGVGAPFPRGNEVEAGDLTLLDPVMDQSVTWRRTTGRTTE